jgi:hypothetical protein
VEESTRTTALHGPPPDLWLYQAVNGDCGDSVLLGTFKASASGDGSKGAVAPAQGDLAR